MARRATAQRLRTKVDQVLLGSFPGYAFVKGLMGNMQQSQEVATSFVRFEHVRRGASGCPSIEARESDWETGDATRKLRHWT